MNKPITFSAALTGFQLNVDARHLSPNTVRDYWNTYKKFQAFLAGDPPFAAIDRDQLQRFLADQPGLSNKTILNYHTNLSALWQWASAEQLAPANLLRLIDPPKPERTEIVPFTEYEMKTLLGAVPHSRPYGRPGKKTTSHALPEALRNRAIILTLLDTGARSSELCNLLIYDVELRSPDKRISIRQGKGKKDRHIPISPRTAQAIWKYLAGRPGARLDDPLFATDSGRPIDRCNLGNMLESLGARAGVQNVHPHRFRHTFAITFLRNGGDIYTLQAILGHETLEMCRRYLAIAQVDIDAAHRRASPVDNWNL
jgi:integrase/recombinase XerD